MGEKGRPKNRPLLHSYANMEALAVQVLFCPNIGKQRVFTQKGSKEERDGSCRISFPRDVGPAHSVWQPQGNAAPHGLNPSIICFLRFKSAVLLFAMFQRILRPPSTGIARPVIKEASSLAKKAITLATSLGSPIRPMGCFCKRTLSAAF